ncbi:methyltransferase family protein [Acidisarcina polymorpha]|uniref:methyltransferase family protein n=1 Tax=Acidisarcina polymorpha TaxID=2211140 RepID=UPI001374EBC3|nr:isoprenylcysteine carboxylmethyltransferase family protein [Acidisarcina polymorpha]
MKATRFEFRFRVAIICVLYFLGFFAPWERFGAAASPYPRRLWSWLAILLARNNLLSLGNAYLVVTIATVTIAILGALLRVWGTAYLGNFVMRHPAMQAGAVMAAGPYRYLRNPLYLGMMLTASAVAVLMPVSGAVVFLAGMLLLTIRLIAAEEFFLSAQLGPDYALYRKSVPSILPMARTRPAASPARPRWLQGIVAESFPVGTAACFAILAWSYDADLLTRCILVCFGGSLIVHALISTRKMPAAMIR